MSELISLNDKYGVSENININWVYDFSREHLTGLIGKLGKQNVGEHLFSKVKMEIAQPIGYIVEIGGALAITKYDDFENLAEQKRHSVISMYVAMLDMLLNLHLFNDYQYDNGGAYFYNIEAHNVLLSRVINFQTTRDTLECSNYADFVNTMYLMHLIGFTNCSKLKYITLKNESEKRKLQKLNPFGNKHDEFDSFSSMIAISLTSFSFSSSRYEIWRNEILLDSGNAQTEIRGEVIYSQSESREQLQVNLDFTKKLNDFILPEFRFDAFVTFGNRLLLFTIPQSRSEDCPGLSNFRSVFIATSSENFLEKKQPYGCSLFYKNNLLTKVSLTINAPDSTLELYT